MSSLPPRALSEVGEITRLVVKHVRDAFGDQRTVDAEWRPLNFTSRPDFSKALEEYDRFLDLLVSSDARLQFLPKASGTGLDSIYVRDASVVCDRGVILCSMGKARRAWEPNAQAAAYLHRRFDSRDALMEIVDGVGYPLIVRADEEHTQAGMHVCHDRAEVAALPAESLRCPGSVTPLVDARAGYRDRLPGSVWARYHHKKRIIVLGGAVVNAELFFAPSPIVSATTCTFRWYTAWRARLHALSRLRRWHRACVDADLAYWRAGGEHRDVMVRAVRALGLDWAAIDYAELADGGVMLWEANPYFWLPPADLMYLPRERRIAERHAALYEAIGDWFESLLAGRAAAA